MTSQTFTTIASPYRRAGRFAIASGAIGIIAIGFLIAFLITRMQDLGTGVLMLSCNNGSLAIQLALMIPLILALRTLLQHRSRGMSKIVLNVGIGALLLTIFCLLMGILRIFHDGLFTFPHGIFGVWLIIVNWRLKGIFLKGLAWYGMIVGFGLMLIGTFEPLFAVFVNPILLRIPAAPVEEITKVIKINTADMIIHYIFFAGSFLGVLILPFWSILMGIKLLREKSF